MNKKVILATVIILTIAVVLFGFFYVVKGWNVNVIDTEYRFNYAYISMPDGSCCQGEIKSWRDWSDSDMVQVIFTDDTIYFTHSSNVVLIKGD